MKNIIVFGASGSVGLQALKVIKNNNNYQLIGVSVGQNLKVLEKILNDFSTIKFVYSSQPSEKLVAKFPHINFLSGFQIVDLVNKAKQHDVVINSLSGFYGLQVTLQAIKNNLTILLANKESLVVAGKLVNDELKKSLNAKIISIDSEHSAILQCLEEGNQIEKIYLTASGGSLRDLTLSETKFVTQEQVLNHPNWKMGSKITVDSATMMNKAFEIIEAYHLFKTKNIEVLLHPQSIVHSMVEFEDFSVKAQLSVPDMSQVINYGLNFPKRLKHPEFQKLDFKNWQKLELKTIDQKRFKPIAWAFECLNSNNSKAICLNAANEVLVEAFLNNEIAFWQITDILEKIFNSSVNKEINDYNNIKEYDLLIRSETRNLIKQ
ncbi:1-deoxy-D-xylulose-5-phosphate reductoisomerase [Spiroplasma alleghenense]|uniref:1-deoxy-D-xylulose 5-phosphate reductoisomerase n=1 Tax=Spiroplasma alleghenense TaxID=216931 RepID=A0A345Z3U1_9MOLU|nr:1-deoxy-D-xylulose-5-phosphate reductoisomerase [Spiroplasma alleghenense]AXK51270.1 1-deoxy-D-xylulose 5-phosphate reductoisomerase [Spiroplasma alleghenense]